MVSRARTSFAVGLAQVACDGAKSTGSRPFFAEPGRHQEFVVRAQSAPSLAQKFFDRFSQLSE